jgi:hypothetical protein
MRGNACRAEPEVNTARPWPDVSIGKFDILATYAYPTSPSAACTGKRWLGGNFEANDARPGGTDRRHPGATA